MPLVFEYPETDDPCEIADVYWRRIEVEQVWPFYFGQAGQDGAVVVNFGALTGVSVSRAKPLDTGLPIYENSLSEDYRSSDIFKSDDEDEAGE